ncbi:MAG: hypothetical protein WBE18_00500, partial [Gammaproteobacteria bacterium]
MSLLFDEIQQEIASKEYEGAMIAIQQLSEMSDFQNRPMILAELYLILIDKIIFEEDEEQHDQERQSRLIRAAIDQAIQKAQIVGVNSKLAKYFFDIGKSLNSREEFRRDSDALYLEAIRLSEPEDIDAIIKYKLALVESDEIKQKIASKEYEGAMIAIQQLSEMSDFQNRPMILAELYLSFINKII